MHIWDREVFFKLDFSSDRIDGGKIIIIYIQGDQNVPELKKNSKPNFLIFKQKFDFEKKSFAGSDIFW